MIFKNCKINLLWFLLAWAMPASGLEVYLDSVRLGIPDAPEIVDVRYQEEIVFGYSRMHPVKIISIKKIGEAAEKSWGCTLGDMTKVLFANSKEDPECKKERLNRMRAAFVNHAVVRSGSMHDAPYYIACKPANSCALFIVGKNGTGGYIVLSSFLDMDGMEGLLKGDGQDGSE